MMGIEVQFIQYIPTGIHNPVMEVPMAATCEFVAECYNVNSYPYSNSLQIVLNLMLAGF